MAVGAGANVAVEVSVATATVGGFRVNDGIVVAVGVVSIEEGKQPDIVITNTNRLPQYIFLFIFMLPSQIPVMKCLYFSFDLFHYSSYRC
jgi:hypothetical protein